MATQIGANAMVALTVTPVKLTGNACYRLTTQLYSDQLFFVLLDLYQVQVHLRNGVGRALFHFAVATCGFDRIQVCLVDIASDIITVKQEQSNTLMFGLLNCTALMSASRS